MRIWHQSFAVLESLPDYRSAIESHLKLILRPGSEVVLHGQRPGTYQSDYPADDLAHFYLFQMHGNQWVANATAAQDEGFDVYAICSLVDPWIREIRSLVDIPVVAYGEACFHLASQFGQRFGVLLFQDKAAPLYHEHIRQYGLAANCAGIGKSGVSFSDVVNGFPSPDPVIERFLEAARDFIRGTGADVIIPGELPMSMMLAVNGINRVDDVPIMDGLAVTIKLAEMMVDIRRSTGIRHSRAGFFNASPPAERVRYMKNFYGVDRLENKP